MFNDFKNELKKNDRESETFLIFFLKIIQEFVGIIDLSISFSRSFLRISAYFCFIFQFKNAKFWRKQTFNNTIFLIISCLKLFHIPFFSPQVPLPAIFVSEYTHYNRRKKIFIKIFPIWGTSSFFRIFAMSQSK